MGASVSQLAWEDASYSNQETKEEIYSSFECMFPKVCKCCLKEYKTFKQFRTQTSDVINNADKVSPIKIDRFGIYYYGNCECGSTLTLWLKKF